MTKCKRCGHDTNHKTGICIACNFDREFGQREEQPLPKPSVRRATSQNNKHKQLLYDLELLLKAQIGHIFNLVHDGKFYEATKRINIVQKELKKNKHAK